MAFFTYPPNESQTPAFTNLAVARADVASTATINALSSSTSFVRITGTTATTINGIVAGNDGQLLYIWNNSTGNMTLANEAAGASAADRITTNTGSNVATTGIGAAILIYDASASRWRLISSAA